MALPGLNRLRAEAAKVLQRWPDEAPEPAGNREQIIRDFAGRLDRADWRDLTMARALTAARIAYEPDFRERNDLVGVRDFLVAETRASTKVSFLGGMCSIYLSSFVPGALHTKALAAALQSVQARLGGKWRPLLQNLPQLFISDQVAETIATRMMTMDQPWLGLKEIGISSPHAPGMLDFAHLAFVKRLSPFLDRRQSAEMLVAWLRPEGQPARDGGAPEAIDALMAPWQSGAPPEAFRDFLLQSLRSMYGDPRIIRGSVWDRIAPASRATIMRWLTGENIRFFLDVVSRVEDSHMWEPRRKFWLSLHEQKKIDEAWVAFSPLGASEARGMIRGLDRSKSVAFGTQTAGGTRANTSLLILKIGRCIVVEGSHDYKVHVFDGRSRHCPKLFEPRYDCEDIRNLPAVEAAVRHHGNWQSRVLEQIEYLR
jgi:hypothetical protein